jgi:hypothetical protein
MKDINVKIKELNVLDFSTRDSSVTFELVSDNCKINKTIVIDDPEEIADDLILEVRRFVKSKNKRPESEDILGNIINVKIEEEDKIISKISFFLGKLSDSIDIVKNANTSNNYLKLINEVKSMKLEF